MLRVRLAPVVRWHRLAMLAVILAGPVAALELPGRVSAAPGYRPLSFTPPKPGSYVLPELGVAADGDVLTTQGQSSRLHERFGGKIALLSLVYATCDDVNGCPLATQVMSRVGAALQSTPDRADSVRLITLSFNPDHDTPAVMARYGQGFQRPGIDWQFLTTRSKMESQPILEAYGQKVQPEPVQVSKAGTPFSHVLRVFLIDRKHRIRNIYSTSTLHSDLILADIQTLLLESSNSAEPKFKGPVAASELLRSGDDKQGYERADYQTHAVSLGQRRGRAADLYRIAQRGMLGLPKVDLPVDNPLTPDKIRLGRKLFYDRRLSFNDTFSCAMCHIPEQGFTSHEQATAIGLEGRTVRRNSPTLYNVAFMEWLFHDGRETRLENQVWGPLLAHNEMANPSIGFVTEKIRHLRDYNGLFERAFRRGPDMETVGQALACYERTLIAGNSPFDRWRYGKEAKAMTSEAQQGYRLFMGKAGCSACHSVGPETALFTDQAFHDTGIAYRATMEKKPPQTRVQVVPGISLDMAAASLDAVSEAQPADLGRYEITQNPADRWKFRTPGLRNIALTGPYMHNGELSTLRDVIEFYARGGNPHEMLDPLIRPLDLNETEKQSLVVFLESLTGSSVQGLVSDAWDAPVGQR